MEMLVASLPHTLDVGEGRRPPLVSDHLHDGKVVNAPSPEALPQQPPSRQVFITPLLGDKTLNLGRLCERNLLHVPGPNLRGEQLNP